MIAILGAGPHGQQLQSLIPSSKLYDDAIPSWAGIERGVIAFPWVVGAAWPEVRRNIVRKAENVKGAWPAALLADNLEPGTILFPGAQIGSDVILKSHVHVEFNAVVSHGCTVKDFVTVCPNATLAGEVEVGEATFIGAGATVIHGGITIGKNCIIGAGAVVINDFPDHSIVAGVPAKRIGSTARW